MFNLLQRVSRIKDSLSALRHSFEEISNCAVILAQNCSAKENVRRNTQGANNHFAYNMRSAKESARNTVSHYSRCQTREPLLYYYWTRRLLTSYFLAQSMRRALSKAKSSYSILLQSVLVVLFCMHSRRMKRIYCSCAMDGFCKRTRILIKNRRRSKEELRLR